MSQWANQKRYLGTNTSSEPGRWQSIRTPYLDGIMDAMLQPHVECVVCLKPTQVGFSEATRNCIGYWIDQDPGPCLMVMPSEKSVRETFEERLKPLLSDSPALAAHQSSRQDDTTLSVIKLDTMHLYSGWAGSPQSLATRPCRYVVYDEVDKYPPFAGREADPIRLGLKRLETYGHRARVLIGSTPTKRDGAIYTWWESCGDQRHYMVPCPECKTFQRLVWPQVKWPKDLEASSKKKRADQIQLDSLAWYECEQCKAQLKDIHKPKMLAAGRWVGSEQEVNKHGRVAGPATKATRVGFHLNSLYSPWVSWSKLACEFIMAKGNPALMMDFRNSRMAEPFEDRVASTSKSLIKSKAMVSQCEPGEVPAWASLLIATADTQKDHFYYTIRAWGYEYRSSLVLHGVVSTFPELARVCLESGFKHPVLGTVSPQGLLIDSGGGRGDSGESRTDEVYQFALMDPTRIKPIKGASHKQSRPWRYSKQPNGLLLVMIDTEFFKDMVTRLIHDPDQAKWQPHSQVDDDYCQQMASEHKIFDRKRNTRVWEPVTAGAANHYWDCEVYQALGAYMANVAYERPPVSTDKTEPDDTDTPKGGGWAGAHKGRW